MAVKLLAFAQEHAQNLVKPKELDEMVHKTGLPGHEMPVTYGECVSLQRIYSSRN